MSKLLLFIVLSNCVGIAGEALVRNVINTAAVSNVFADRNDRANVAVVDVRRAGSSITPRLYAKGSELPSATERFATECRECSFATQSAAMPWQASKRLPAGRSQSGSPLRHPMSHAAAA